MRGFSPAVFPPLFVLITTVNGAGDLLFPPRRVEAGVGAFTEYLTSSELHAPLLVTGTGYTDNFPRHALALQPL